MEETSTAPPRRLDALTSLRFFAAAIVVLYHCGQDALGFMPLGIRGLMKNGYQAVSFFFVLSGFVLAYSYYTPVSVAVRGGVPAFWKNRFARIYPVYLAAIIVALPRYLWSVKAGMVQAQDAHIALVAVPFLIQAWFFSVGISGAINLPAWSLSVEAFFYGAFPVLLRMTTAFGPVLMTSLAFAGLVCSESLVTNSESYFPPYHLCTFLVGVGCGVWFRRASPRPIRVFFYCVAIALCGILAFRDLIPGYFLSRVVLVPLFGALIVTTASCAGALRLLEHRFAVLLGDSSYCLYILHIPIYGLFVAALRRVNVEAGTSPWWTLCYLTAIITLSVLAHQWIEIPARLKILGVQELPATGGGGRRYPDRPGPARFLRGRG